MAEWVLEGDTWWYVLPSGVRRRGEIRVCQLPGCGKEFPYHKTGRNLGLYCGREHANQATKPMRGRRGSDNPNWKGGHVNKDGYREIYVTKPDGGRKLVLEHRHVMEKIIGRELLPSETVHHVNGDKQNNAPSNLELWSTWHPRGQRVGDLLAFAYEIIETYADVPLR